MRTRSSATELRHFKREAKEREAKLRDEIHRLRRSVELAETRLMEARRRTIPGPDGEDWNFLPIQITSVEVLHDPIKVHIGVNSARRIVGYEAKAAIKVSGDLVYTGPAKTTVAD